MYGAFDCVSSAIVRMPWKMALIFADTQHPSNHDDIIDSARRRTAKCATRFRPRYRPTVNQAAIVRVLRVDGNWYSPQIVRESEVGICGWTRSRELPAIHVLVLVRVAHRGPVIDTAIQNLRKPLRVPRQILRVVHIP